MVEFARHGAEVPAGLELPNARDDRRHPIAPLGAVPTAVGDGFERYRFYDAERHAEPQRLTRERRPGPNKYFLVRRWRVVDVSGL